jgi:hypothetical protein
MQKANKYLLAGLAIGLVIAAVATYALTAGQVKSGNGLALDCSQCHAEGHGSVIAPDININGTILLTGDLPKDEYVVVDDIFKLPQKDIRTLESQYPEGVPSRGVGVLEFLRAHGVTDFDRLVVYADDFMLSLKRSDINDNTILVPKEYSVRILGDNMPIATWLEGVRSVVVVGGAAGDAIAVGDKKVTFGHMLESGIQTMPVSLRTLGYVYKNDSYNFDTGFLVNGISLKDLLFKEGYTDFNSVSVDSLSLSGNGVLTGNYFLTRNNGTIVLATSDKNRPDWPEVKTIAVN